MSGIISLSWKEFVTAKFKFINRNNPPSFGHNCSANCNALGTKKAGALVRELLR